MAVGTNTVTSANVGGNVTRYTCTWLSDGAGDESANPFAVASGDIILVKVVPDAGGTMPDALHDVYLKDEDGIDLLSAVGLDNSQTLGRYLQFTTPFFHDSVQDLDLVIAGAGAANGGIVYIWVRNV